MTKTSFTTRLSYTLPDIGGQMIFGFISFNLAYFYSNVYGIAAGTAGTILLIARWVDAIEAPIWGLVFDRTSSRWGKSRPWFLWLCLPFATFGTLTFVTPDLSHNAKVVYAAVTYIVSSILYTGINTPITSILSTLTSNPQERVTLTAFRMIGSKLGVLAVNLTGMRMVRWLGSGNDQRGFLLTLPIFAAVSIIAFLLAFRNLREVVVVESKAQPIRGTFRALKGNWPWIIIFMSSLLFWIGFGSRVTVTRHYFEMVLKNPNLADIANALDFTSLATALLLPWLCRRLSKSLVWGLGLAGMVIGVLVSFAGMRAGQSLWLIMTGWTMSFVASGAAMAMPFSVLSESVDYGEWKTGVRAAGLLSAVGAAFCLKAGFGLGGAMPMWLLEHEHFDAKAAITPAIVHALEIGLIWIPTLCLSLAIVPVLFYRKYELMEPQIQADLQVRRAK